MKVYTKLAALLMALLLLLVLFGSCTKEATTDAPEKNSPPVSKESQPAPPQLGYGDVGSMPVFEW